MKKSKQLFCTIIFSIMASVVFAQNTVTYYAVITMTNTKHNNEGHELTRIISNIFPIEVDEESIGYKLRNEQVANLRWEYLNFLEKNYPNEVRKFNGKFNIGTITLSTKPTKSEITSRLNGKNFNEGMGNHKEVNIDGFQFKYGEENFSKVNMALNGYLRKGKKISELSVK